MKRKGYVDQFLVLTVVFSFFVYMLFLVIGYANVARVQYNLDTMSGVLSRMVSTGKTTEQLVSKVNSLKLSMFSQIDEDAIQTDCNASGSNKIVFKIWALYDPPVLGEFNVTATSSAYNEQNSSDCNFFIELTQN